jgi:hypothetical protein
MGCLMHHVRVLSNELLRQRDIRPTRKTSMATHQTSAMTQALETILDTLTRNETK